MSTQLLAENMVDVLGVRFHRVSMSEAVEKILYWVGDKHHHMVITAGPEFVMQCQINHELMKLADSADLVTADGIGVVWAASRNGRPVPERVTGVELLPAVFGEAEARKQRLKIYLLGAGEESLQAALKSLRATYPYLEFEGRNGYFTADEQDEIVRDIRQFSPNLFLVGLGQPRQEFFIRNMLGRLEPCVAVGIGGSIDVWGGTVQRAPVAFQKVNMEWLYRLVAQPSRLRRQLNLPRFAWAVLRGASGQK